MYVCTCVCVCACVQMLMNVCACVDVDAWVYMCGWSWVDAYANGMGMGMAGGCIPLWFAYSCAHVAVADGRWRGVQVLYNAKDNVGDQDYGDINVHVREGFRKDGYGCHPITRSSTHASHTYYTYIHMYMHNIHTTITACMP